MQIAVERVRNAEESVDSRWPSTALEPGDRRLGRPDPTGQLALGETPRGTTFRKIARDGGKEPVLVRTSEARSQALGGSVGLLLLAVSHICDHSEIAIAVNPRNVGRVSAGATQLLGSAVVLGRSGLEPLEGVVQVGPRLLVVALAALERSHVREHAARTVGVAEFRQ